MTASIKTESSAAKDDTVVDLTNVRATSEQAPMFKTENPTESIPPDHIPTTSRETTSLVQSNPLIDTAYLTPPPNAVTNPSGFSIENDSISAAAGTQAPVNQPTADTGTTASKELSHTLTGDPDLHAVINHSIPLIHNLLNYLQGANHLISHNTYITAQLEAQNRALLQQLQEAREEAAASNDLQQRALSSLEDELDRRSESIKTKQQALSGRNATIKMMQEEMQSLKRDLDDRNKIIESLQLENRHLEKAVKAAEGGRMDLMVFKKRLSEAEEENDRMKKRFRSSVQEMDGEFGL